MPTLSFFYGIRITMYWNDHPPPHFHAEFSGYRAVFDIQKMEMSRGRLPTGAKLLVLEWMKLHQAELLEAWDKCSKEIPPSKITPLP